MKVFQLKACYNPRYYSCMKTSLLAKCMLSSVNNLNTVNCHADVKFYYRIIPYYHYYFWHPFYCQPNSPCNSSSSYHSQHLFSLCVHILTYLSHHRSEMAVTGWMEFLPWWGKMVCSEPYVNVFSQLRNPNFQCFPPTFLDLYRLFRNHMGMRFLAIIIYFKYLNWFFVCNTST